MLDTMTNEEFLHYLEHNPEVDILNLTYDEQQQLLIRFAALETFRGEVDDTLNILGIDFEEGVKKLREYMLLPDTDLLNLPKKIQAELVLNFRRLDNILEDIRSRSKEIPY